MLNGSVNIGDLWRPDVLLQDNKLTVYVELHNFVAENVVDGVRVNTASVDTMFADIDLKRVNGLFEYNVLFSDDQELSLDSFGIEVFVAKELVGS